MLSKNPTLSPAQVQQIMMATAVDIEAPGFDRLAGAGRVDALAAVAAVPCLDPDALPAEAACEGEKAPRGAAAAYRAVRRKLVASARRTGLAAARKRLARAVRIVERKAVRGRLSAACAGRVEEVVCRIAG